MNRLKALALVLAGIALGCGAATTIRSSWAGPTPGQWTCYRGWKFPAIEVDDDATRGMNLTAGSAAAGTVFAFQGKERADNVCVRD